MLYVHRVHNRAGMFDVMLDTPLDIADCRTVRVQQLQLCVCQTAFGQNRTDAASADCRQCA